MIRFHLVSNGFTQKWNHATESEAIEILRTKHRNNTDTSQLCPVQSGILLHPPHHRDLCPLQGRVWWCNTLGTYNLKNQKGTPQNLLWLLWRLCIRPDLYRLLCKTHETFCPRYLWSRILRIQILRGEQAQTNYRNHAEITPSLYTDNLLHRHLRILSHHSVRF